MYNLYKLLGYCVINRLVSCSLLYLIQWHGIVQDMTSLATTIPKGPMVLEVIKPNPFVFSLHQQIVFQVHFLQNWWPNYISRLMGILYTNICVCALILKYLSSFTVLQSICSVQLLVTHHLDSVLMVIDLFPHIDNIF